MTKAYLLLGSNLGNRISNINNAIDLISLRTGKITAKSSIYDTEPWGVVVTGNEDSVPMSFLNMVLQLETEVDSVTLLKELLEIELLLGRQRTDVKNESRTIDIDILFFGDQIIETTELEIPHKRLHKRKFVLVPMAEIDPLFIHPVFNLSISQLLEVCEDKKWVRKFEHE